MTYRLWQIMLVTLILLSNSPLIAQSDEEGVTAPETQEGIIFKPTIGLGVGMFAFYGDITRGEKTNSPIVSRIGYDLRVAQTLTPHFDLYFHVLFGKLGANERSDTRNANFESTLRLGGVGLTYNFHHILKPSRVIEPYLSIGIESFEFSSKTDLRDAYGTEYHYWSNGSIKNLAEDDPNAKEAKVITRDYVYDTDVKENSIDIDGIPSYVERSFAIPIGFGANLHATDRIKFRVGTAYHLTFTDNIDGISENSLGNRKGDSRNDHFLYSSFSLNYYLSGNNLSEFDEDFSDVDFLAIDMGDEDEDGVIDFKDKCAHTPIGEIVDIEGCPMDEDADGVPDYADQEEFTADSLYADLDGIGLTEDKLEKRWRMYMDSTGAYAKHEIATNVSDRIERKTFALRYEGKTDEISPEIADLFLSYTDTKTIEENGKTIFELGDYDYDDLPSAIRDALNLKNKGVDGVQIVEKYSQGGVAPVSNEEIADAANKAGIDIGQKDNANQSELLYRIQLGAFSRPIDPKVFVNIPDLVYYKGDDGLTRYFTGAYNSYGDAAKQKIDVVSEGFSGAFVVPLKGGTKVALSETGSATPATQTSDVDKHENISSTNSNIKFKVQVGAYNKQIPIDILEKFMSLGVIEPRHTDEGVTKYVAGNYSSADEAKEYKQNLLDQGYDGAFLVGEFNGKIISFEEAIELLNK